jgi:hypothetical protein
MPVDENELEICRRRGHGAGILTPEWNRCKWCGMWVREVRMIEERIEDPPRNEVGAWTKLTDKDGTDSRKHCDK